MHVITRVKSQNHFPIIAISLITLLAALLRFKGLTFQSYWFDELYSLTIANPGNSYREVLQGARYSVHPPLYHTLLWLCYQTVGYTELTGRALSAVLGTLSIPALYWLGRELLNRETGLYASLLAAVNPALIFYSQEVRPYSLFVLLACLSLALFLRALRTLEWPDLLFFIAVTVALAYTHYFGLLVIFTEFLYLICRVVRRSPNTGRMLLFAAVTTLVLAAAFIPLFLPVLEDVSRQSFWIQLPGRDFLVNYINLYFGRSYVMAGIVVVLALIGVLLSLARALGGADGEELLLIVLLVIVLVVVPYTFSILFIPVLLARNLLCLVPALLLLAAAGIYCLGARSAKITTVVLLTCLFVYNLFMVRDYYNTPYKEDYRYLINDVLKAHGDIPAYAERSRLLLGTYAQMLDYEKRIRPLERLEKELDSDSGPSCFFIIENKYNFSRGKINDFVAGHDLEVVKKIRGRKVRALLLSVDQKSIGQCESLLH